MTEQLSQGESATETTRAADPAITEADPHTSFVVVSCRYPTGLLDGTRREHAGLPGPADRSESQLLDWYQKKIGNGQIPILRLGDQIYVDASAGLFDPASLKARFERPYKARFREHSPYDVLVGHQFRTFAMLDDHEIDDNWEPCVIDCGDNEELLDRGRRAYIRHARQRGWFDLQSPNRLWRDDIRLDDEFPIFFADTRTERQHRTAATVCDRHIFSTDQLGSLLAWLKKPCDDGRPRFVASPAMLLPRRLLSHDRDLMSSSAIRIDAWEGYPKTLSAVLSTLVENEISDVIFLSGDEHLSNFAKITISDSNSDKTATVYSIHSSAFYAPFPFANAKKEDFYDKENFCFPRWHAPDRIDNEQRFECTVDTIFTEHVDGFCTVQVAKSNGRWNLDVGFLGAYNEALTIPRFQI